MEAYLGGSWEEPSVPWARPGWGLLLPARHRHRWERD